MRGFIALTDYQWYKRLLALEPDEVNFWRPMDTRAFRSLQPLEPLLFKLKSAHGNYIAGFGIYAGFMTMGVSQAWEWFSEANGVLFVTARSSGS